MLPRVGVGIRLPARYSGTSWGWCATTVAVVTSSPATASDRAIVFTVSDRAAAGIYADRSGPRAAELLAAGGFATDVRIIPDGENSVRDALQEALTGGARLIVTTGGTGVAPRDRTPEGTSPLLTLLLPGLAAEIRRAGLPKVATSVLSRGLAGVAGTPPRALVVNLAGSVGAVEDGIPVVLSVAGHVLAQLDGGAHG